MIYAGIILGSYFLFLIHSHQSRNRKKLKQCQDSK